MNGLHQGATGWLLVIVLMAGCAGPRPRPVEVPASPVPPDVRAPAADDRPGPRRPYELEWNPRHEAHDPLVDFEFLLGWGVAPGPGMEAEFERSSERPLWGRHAGRLRFQGGVAGILEISPPEPVAISGRVDSMQLWVHGPDGVVAAHRPRVAVILDDAAGQRVQLPLGEVTWAGWNLLHRRVPSGTLAALEAPFELAAIRWENCRADEPVTYFMDSLAAYTERRAALTVTPCPAPDEPAAPAGAPASLEEPDRGRFVFRCDDAVGELEYDLDAATLGEGIRVRWNGEECGRFLRGVEAESGGILGGGYRVARVENDGVYIEYTNGITCSLSVEGNRLHLAVEDRGGAHHGLRWEPSSSADAWHALAVPGLTARGDLPIDLGWMDGRSNCPPLFVCTRLDWNQSAASAFAGYEARYDATSDGTRHRLSETMVLAVAPRMEDVFPPAAPPAGIHEMLQNRIWVDSDGPVTYAASLSETERLAGLGIQDVVQGHTPECWRDGEESCTLRDRAAPGKGGDEALRAFLNRQRAVGWMPGLFVDYLQVHPLNAHWAEPILLRDPDLNWRPGLPGHVRIKPLVAADLQARLAPVIEERFAPSLAYLGDMAGALPWMHTDYDAVAPGAGRFDAAYHCIRQLLQAEAEIRPGPVVSDGGAEALYADAYHGYLVRDRDYPDLLLPGYILQVINPQAVRIGAGDQLRSPVPDTPDPAMLDRALDRYLAHQVAFGAAGRLAPPAWGPARQCRSYYMMQLLQPLYLGQSPRRVSYWDGSAYVNASQAVVGGAIDQPRLYVGYGEETEVWVNGDANDAWVVRVGADTWTLPPYGWVVAGTNILEISAIVDGRRIDYVSSGLTRYLDGRGSMVQFRGLAASGPLLVRVTPDTDGYRLSFVDPTGRGQFGFMPPDPPGKMELGVTEYDEAGTMTGRGTARLRDGMYWVEGHAFRYDVEITDTGG